jgi:hypothetical protein
VKITQHKGADMEADIQCDTENTSIVLHMASAPSTLPRIDNVFGNAAEPVDPPKKLLVTSKGDVIAQPPVLFDPCGYKVNALEEMRNMFDKHNSVADLKCQSWILIDFSKPALCEDLFKYLTDNGLCDVVGVAQHPGTNTK